MIAGPRKSKFRKVFKGKIHGHATSGAGLQFGTFGLKALEPGRMTAKQIEAARRCISRAMKREGKFWSRMFPHIPVTGKAIGTRMGGGKGNIENYIAKVYPGTMLFELSGVTMKIAKDAFSLASEKLPFAVQFVKEEVGVYVEYK